MAKTKTTKNRTLPLPLAVWGEIVDQIKLDKQHRKFLWSSFPPTSSPPRYGLGKKTFLLNQRVRQCSSSSPTDTAAQMMWARGESCRGSTAQPKRTALKQHYGVSGAGTEFVSVTSRVPEDIWQPRVQAQAPDCAVSLLQHKDLAAFVAVILSHWGPEISFSLTSLSHLAPTS